MSAGDKAVLIVLYCAGMVWMVLQCAFAVDITLCPTKLIFHIPCPGCGMTRACMLLLQGNVVEAIKMNPNILIAFPLIIGIPFCYFAKGGTENVLATQIRSFFGKKIFTVAILAFEIAVWTYNIVRGI